MAREAHAETRKRHQRHGETHERQARHVEPALEPQMHQIANPTAKAARHGPALRDREGGQRGGAEKHRTDIGERAGGTVAAALHACVAAQHAAGAADKDQDRAQHAAEAEKLHHDVGQLRPRRAQPVGRRAEPGRIARRVEGRVGHERQQQDGSQPQHGERRHGALPRAALLDGDGVHHRLDGFGRVLFKGVGSGSGRRGHRGPVGGGGRLRARLTKRDGQS